MIQAWKKTVTYIRRHNWYVDTLLLDTTSVNLRQFMAESLERIGNLKNWKSRRLRIVLAPKSQHWEVSSPDNTWAPKPKKKNSETGTPPPIAPLRPLAHVDISDQVVATALMLCLANRVETKQGDPRKSIRSLSSRKEVISYGNRLFCDANNGQLHHRWGSSNLYRGYYQDYRCFLSRPDQVVKSLLNDENRDRPHIFVVHSDLRQFYDRVRPHHLVNALQYLKEDDDEKPFFDFAEQVLNWSWDPQDEKEIGLYVDQLNVDDFDFTHVALPQGLVSAGFFANVVLLKFDEKLQELFGKNIDEDIYLEDACRYVDDLRITVTSRNKYSPEDIKIKITTWLQDLLHAIAPGLEVSSEKTKAREVTETDNPLMNQSVKMNRIQSAVSGGFDAIGGIEILDSIQSLMHAQEALPQEANKTIWRLSPLADVRKETVARFSAARYRAAYRSVRPLLEAEETPEAVVEAALETSPSTNRRAIRTQLELDEDMRIFAFGLIEQWVADPSNVRLLRIGLDLWPDGKVLEEVLNLLRPLTETTSRKRAPQRVAWYCLSELLRAGATETGWVEEREARPSTADIRNYRAILFREAERLINLPTRAVPWYLQQQALLYLAVFSPENAPIIRAGTKVETKSYRAMIIFLRREKINRMISDNDFATMAILAHRSFPHAKTLTKLIRQQLTPKRASEIAVRDLSLAYDLVNNKACPFSATTLPENIQDDLCLRKDTKKGNYENLASIVLDGKFSNVLRDELTVLRFAEKFLEELQKVSTTPSAITPAQVWLKLKGWKNGATHIEKLQIDIGRASHSDSFYRPPNWSTNEECWRFHLGFLMRFILSGQPDFTRHVRPPHWRTGTLTYRKAESHWYQRLHGMFSGQRAFGDDWLPITDWMEKFLLALLHWPGCRTLKNFPYVKQGLKETLLEIKKRVKKLSGAAGRSSGTVLLTVNAQQKYRGMRKLQICVVQTAVPEDCDFTLDDLSLSGSLIRKRHRNHLSAALAGVTRIMDFRNTHMKHNKGLDWLILPELAVHPKDVETHLMPFARAHKTLVLAGLTYEEFIPNQPLKNSAIWILPEWSEESRLQLRTRRQGKRHLSPNEERRFNVGLERIQGFRPCQWLVNYPWADEDTSPLILTGSICYDATDLSIISDLRGKSDVLAIPSLNQDVATFDQMALALHYHMFQLVIVANNGQYGGSSAYWPAKGFKKQIFHLHGQPQASITFFEIDDIESFQERAKPGNSPKPDEWPWKYPPADLRTKK